MNLRIWARDNQAWLTLAISATGVLVAIVALFPAFRGNVPASNSTTPTDQSTRRALDPERGFSPAPDATNEQTAQALEPRDLAGVGHQLADGRENVESLATAQAGWGKGTKSAPEGEVVAQHQTYFAQGKLEARLVKGGPSRLMVWAHMHGRHAGRAGRTSYEAGILVTDGSWNYWASEPLALSVQGAWDKPDHNMHKYGQWEMTDSVLEAYSTETKLQIVVFGERERSGDIDTLFNPDAEKVMERYLRGKLTAEHFLELLNDGKKVPR